MFIRRLTLTLAVLGLLSVGSAMDCPADSAYHIDLRTMLPDGQPNPNYGLEIATGLCACLDFSDMFSLTDTTLTLTVLLVDNEPIRGVELDIYHDAEGIIEYGDYGSVAKGSKLENVTDGDGVPKTMTLLANELDDYVKVMAYSTARARTAGDGTEGDLLTVTYRITNGLASLPDSIAFSIGLCNLPGTSMDPSILNVACSYPDTLSPKAIQVVLGVETANTPVPDSYQLSQNYPNPFNPSTNISFALPAAEAVRLNIYNVLGQVVTTLVDQELSAGNYDIVWNGRDSQGQMVASGVYFYELRSDNFTARKKMLFLR